jgi:tetratricopeptide (TPR) repeat protein
MTHRTGRIAVFAALMLLSQLAQTAIARVPIETPGKVAAEALRRGEELRRRWDLDGADREFREAASLNPSSLEAKIGQARIARVRIQYSRAIEVLKNAEMEHSSSSEIFDEYGAIYLAAEEPATARKYFLKALSISSADSAAKIGLAGVSLLERDYQGSIEQLRQVLASEPNNAAARATLARVLLETSRESDAAAEAHRAIELDEYNVEALYVLAYVRSSERKADESRKLSRRVVSLDPYDFAARRMLSQYLDGQAGYEQKVSDQARLHYSRSRSLRQDGAVEAAVAELQEALRIEPNYYRALIALAAIKLRNGELERAVEFARRATIVDPDGAVAQFELSWAYRGLNERARIEIGAIDFRALYYGKPAPPAFAITREIFPNYDSLTRRQQIVVDAAVGPLAMYLPKLAHQKARHYLLSFDQRPSDLHGFADVAGEKTFDGRFYASIRGVGGKVTVSGIEYLDQAALGGFNTIAHEFAHQVHIAALRPRETKEIRKLFEHARQEGRTLDYYAAANEHEYFAQGYEAFISERKRPSAGVTARHTNAELAAIDPELYAFLVRLTEKSRVNSVSAHR